MKDFGTWQTELADWLARGVAEDTIPGLENTPWVGNRQNAVKATHSEDFDMYARWSVSKSCWEAPCAFCGESVEITGPTEDFVFTHHICPSGCC